MASMGLLSAIFSCGSLHNVMFSLQQKGTRTVFLAVNDRLIKTSQYEYTLLVQVNITYSSSTEHNFLLLIIVHCVHTIRDPKQTQLSTCLHMCTGIVDHQKCSSKKQQHTPGCTNKNGWR